MKGKILDFTIQTNTGIIIGDDQKRYNFAGSEWKEQQPPVQDNEVDFEVNTAGQAIGVYLKKVNLLSKNKSSDPDSSQTSADKVFNKLDQEEMVYQQAIVTCFKKFVDFKGRAKRSEFWYFQLFCVLLSLCLSFINEDMASLAMLVTFLPNIAVTARRLHDIDRSGWWMLIAFVPIVGILLLLFWAAQEGNSGSNQYGAPTSA